MRTLTLFMVVALLGMVGCSYSGRLPTIPDLHWHRSFQGAELYTSDGDLVASFVEGHFSEPAEVCDFGADGGCYRYETDEQALNWIVSKYSRGAQ